MVAILGWRRRQALPPYWPAPAWPSARPGVDPLAAIGRLKVTLEYFSDVVAAPAPDVEILDFIGALLAVRPYCHTDHYWQVYFDTNNLIAAIRHRRLSGALCGSGTPRPNFDS